MTETTTKIDSYLVAVATTTAARYLVHAPVATAAAPDLLGLMATDIDSVEGADERFTVMIRPPKVEGKSTLDVDSIMSWATDPDGMDWDLIERNEDWDHPTES